MKQHKWHKEIKAWADGAEIEFRYADRKNNIDDWEILNFFEPNWSYSGFEFRVKPQPIQTFKAPTDPTGIKEPQYLYVYKHFKSGMLDFSLVNENNSPNVEDGQMIYVSKIKLEVEE